ncbi:E3 ubiquitin-protein ligase [Fulvia fulva]|uniref:E3 ubiquitin-protein ligase n=1 Tax=Passalora fulva TaxID=5499 RepID=A0A9Q8LCT0_PASFU|nr:E3 ubiquitin-protein ligase [Fulvia fulva]KAK4630339.1 E3 ubiquitin-protein ligase [Fulvia fulva]UJO15048.1 E3 ubiquitin-protein ligase [Fulvia fulva]WPV12556.1 E3 ubiquitin-protein ligase [Fulvia fulva]
MDLVPLPKATGTGTGTGSRLWKSKADFFRPFRSAAEVGEGIEPLYDPTLPREELHNHDPDLRDLNRALEVLVEVFPDVRVEVFREMLGSVGESSRVEVVTELLVKERGVGVGGKGDGGGGGRRWIRGRVRAEGGRRRGKGRRGGGEGLEDQDLFRSDAYKKAVKDVFYLEFRNLSHSTIRGVLAEQNFSYTLARPILQQLASRSWRFSLGSLWPRKAAGVGADGHPFIFWSHENGSEQATPAVRKTGSTELDHELYELFVEPIITKQRQERQLADYNVACEVNEKEAEAAEALFDCECCFSSVPFEQIATCDQNCHFLCLDCVRRTVNEALYGQGWSRTADLERASVRCFAPSSQDCHGSIAGDQVRQSLTQGSDNEDAWNDFQARITAETLMRTGLSLQRCPFCNYAEVDEPPNARIRHPMAIWHHAMTKSPPAFQIMLLSFLTALTLLTIPILVATLVTWLLLQLFPPAKSALTSSLHRIHKTRRTLRFTCQNPSCAALTCTRCLAPWHNPHTCFDAESTSLRTALEASATLAIKRTCPKCLLSFVKASGCNKLVCNCGYTMCYICRQEITSREGYAHFCQHFRPSGGRCGECERCDLYGDEDEEGAIRRAAEVAEREWREREQGGGEGEEEARKGVRMIEVLVGQGRRRRWWEEWVDVVVDAVVA